jgi:hypothetical protein
MKSDFDGVVAELAMLAEKGGVDKGKNRKMVEMRSMVSVTYNIQHITYNIQHITYNI